MRTRLFSLFRTGRRDYRRDRDAIIQGAAQNYATLFMVNMKDDTFSIIQENSDLNHRFNCKEGFSRFYHEYIDKDVYERDRELVRREISFSNIRSRLTETPTFTFEYCAWTEGVIAWHLAMITRINEDEILLGTIIKDTELLMEHIEKAVLNDFFGIYVANIDVDQLKVIRDSGLSPRTATILPYTVALRHMAESEKGEVRDFYMQLSDPDFVRAILKDDDRQEWSYRTSNTHRGDATKGDEWVKCTVYVLSRNARGNASTFAICYSKLDTLTQQDEMQSVGLSSMMQIVNEGANTNEDTVVRLLETLGNYYQADRACICELTEDGKFLNKTYEWHSPDVAPATDGFLNIPSSACAAWVEALKTDGTVDVPLGEQDAEECPLKASFVKNGISHVFIAPLMLGVELKGFIGVGNPRYEEPSQIVLTTAATLCYSEMLKLKERNQKRIARNNLISSMAGGESLYIVNLRTNTFEAISQTPYLHEHYSDDECYVDSVGRFIETDVLEPDRPMMRETMSVEGLRRRLADDDRFELFYRDISTGTPFWYRMRVIRLSDDELLINFTNRDQAFVEERIQAQRMESYFSLNVIDLDNETVRSIKESPFYDGIPHGVALPFKKAMQLFASSLDGEATEFFNNLSDIDFLRQQWQAEEVHEFSYLSPLARHWVTANSCVISRHADGTPSVITLGFKIADSLHTQSLQMKKAMEENLAIIGGLASEYTALYHVDLSTGVFHNYSISERIADTKANFARFDNFSDLFSNFIKSNAVHPDDRHLFGDLYNLDRAREMMKDKKKHTILFRRKYGEEYLWTEMVVVKYEDVNEPAKSLAVGFVECNAEVRAEQERKQQLQEALAMAQAANKAKTTFLNNMSHDIRTPMNAIIGFTGLAASHIDNKEQVRGYLSKIQQSSNHLLSLINDVLDMSRIESGKMNLNEQEENLSNILHTLRDIVQADIRAKQLDFFMDTVGVNDEDIICDKLRLNQVLLNILSNSIKYTQTGGTVSLSITEKEVNHSGYACYEFCISDNGMGMSEEYLKTIFDPFSRADKNVVGIQGTGLGMAITKSIVEMMGGTIEIQSKLGEGTQTTITFQFKLRGEAHAPEQIPELVGLRALVIDDDMTSCQNISGMLRDFGMKPEWCTTGREAVVRAEEATRIGKPFHLFIVDWQMPGMNGVETTRRLRKIAAETPIIINTSYDWSDVEDEAVEAGVTDFVSKPLFPSDLHRVLVESCLIPCIADDTSDDANVSDDISGRTVLLVEDNELNREIATMLLEESGLTVLTAEDGSIALEKVKNAHKGDFDAVLMDVQMPVMDGYEATRQIRASGCEMSDIPIIAMTANAFEDDRKTAIEAGMNDHIAKPVNIDQLRDTLARYI